MASSFKEIQLFKKEIIGIGAYGSVCKARCDDFICAAKVIHPTLVVDSPTDKSPQGRFRAECEFLSSLRHPNVVQYLGTWQDPDTGLPVLLIELLDGNLTQLLSSVESSLPFHTQVNICHDISLALAFLHSNDIIHRDLSSNNVLMIGDRRAKVTDFGMASLDDLTSKTTKSMCPGTEVYMPPEAIAERPRYTEKIDCFSFGVIVIQILTSKYPSPGNRMKSVVIGGRKLLEQQREISRREEDIKMADSSNPLLPIGYRCLEDGEMDRPSARELCQMIARLKENTMYLNQGQSLHEKLAKKEKELEELSTRLEQLHMKLSDQVDTFANTLIAKDRLIETKDIEISELKNKLQDSQRHIEFMHARELASAGSDGTVSEVESRRDVLVWREGPPAPSPLARSTNAIVCEDHMYVLPDTNEPLYVYDCKTCEWSQLPRCPTQHSTLVTVEDSVVAIGGYLQAGVKTSKLYTLSSSTAADGGIGQHTWVETYPPMPTERDSAAAVCCGERLVVAGGIGRSYLRTVEVMLVETRQWYTAASLPSDMFSSSIATCGDHLYIIGGWISMGTTTYSVITCSLGGLADSCRMTSVHNEEGRGEAGDEDNVWSYAMVLPVTKSTCVSFQNQLLVIGGQDKNGDSSKKVWTYNALSKTWVELSECGVARSLCYAAVLPGNQLVVTGGLVGRQCGETNTSEVAKYDTV